MRQRAPVLKPLSVTDVDDTLARGADLQERVTEHLLPEIEEEVTVPNAWLDADDRLLRGGWAMRSLNHEHQYDLPLRDDNGLDLDRITPGLSRLAAECKADREYCSRVTELGRQYLSDGAVLVHGDFFPGSWLLTGRGSAVIDPEFCFLGPAEYDLSVFLGHLALIGASVLWPLVETRYKGRVDWKWARRFAGAEIMRRLIGVAQLPIPPELGQKREWLEISRRLVCDD